MSTRQTSYMQSLGSLQALAILMVVLGHYWEHDSVFMNSVGVSCCFVYSGFFTALRHEFGPGYVLRQHGAFLGKKLARLYPLHLLAIVLGIAGAFLSWGHGGVSPLAMLAHLTLTSSWIPDPSCYFGANPVAWFICDLFFLQLVSPLVIRWLRKTCTRHQLMLIALLLVLEFAAGYAPDIGTHSRLFGRYTHYMLYQFPPMRLLDFATGVVIYNASQSVRWRGIRQTLSARGSALIEATAVMLSLLLYCAGKWWLQPHCYRAFCASAPGIIVLLSAFVMTCGKSGLLSRLLEVKPLVALSAIGAEVYLLQFGIQYCMMPVYRHFNLMAYPVAYLAIRVSVLLAAAWLTHHYFTAPIYRRLTASRLR